MLGFVNNLNVPSADEKNEEIGCKNYK
jgi:hypothetical protein